MPKIAKFSKVSQNTKQGCSCSEQQSRAIWPPRGLEPWMKDFIQLKAFLPDTFQFGPIKSRTGNTTALIASQVGLGSKSDILKTLKNGNYDPSYPAFYFVVNPLVFGEDDDAPPKIAFGCEFGSPPDKNEAADKLTYLEKLIRDATTINCIVSTSSSIVAGNGVGIEIEVDIDVDDIDEPPPIIGWIIGGLVRSYLIDNVRIRWTSKEGWDNCFGGQC